MPLRLTACLFVLFVLCACDGAPLPPRALDVSCRPMMGDAPVEFLSATGCFEDIERLVPASDLVPYGVRSPLWTDGADKDRYVVVPPGEQIVVDDTGTLELPIGTMLIKVFALEVTEEGRARHRNLEVRFLVRLEVDWEAFTYRIDSDQLEGRLTLRTEEEEIFVPTPDGPMAIQYAYPGTISCRACHATSLRVLGFSTEQLNFRYDYGPARENQLRALADIGLLVEPAGEMSELAALPNPRSSGRSHEERARAWLHANCGHCHRPGGFGGTTGLFLTYDLPFEETNSCRVRTDFYGDVNRIEPGFPEFSGILRRMNQEGARMPPIGVSFVDPYGELLLTRWIENLRECP